jgi:GDP-4-dehydro-6-deoxy-D-mannose reductase
VRVWVTGASGFVARHLVPALKGEGHEVMGVGLLAEPPAWLDPASYRAVDVSRAGDIEALAAEAPPEAVVHLAGQSSAAQSFRAVEETFQQNLGSALGLLEGFRAASQRPRVLMVSTSEVYGPQDSAAPIVETSQLHVVSPYGASKLAAEVIAETYGREYGLPILRIRPFSHTGYGQDTRFALSSFADQIVAHAGGKGRGKLEVGNLEVVRDYLDVQDVVRAYQALLHHGAPGEVYNIASGRGFRMRDLLDRMIELAGGGFDVTVDPARMRAQDLNFLVGDGSRLRSLGWQPGPGMDAALEGLLQWRRDAQAEVARNRALNS